MASVGTCQNVERCSKAAAGELIEMYPGLGEVCPQCGRRLTPAAAPPGPNSPPASSSMPPAGNGASLPTPQFGFKPKYVTERPAEARVATEPAAEKRSAPTTITGSAPPNAFVAPPPPAARPADQAATIERPPAPPPQPPPPAQQAVQPAPAPWTITPQAPPQEPEMPARARRGIPRGVLWGALAAGLLAIGGGSYYLYSGTVPAAHASVPANPAPPPPAAAGSPAFALCTTFSLSDHLAPELLRGFLTKAGGTAVAASSAGAIGQLGGKATRVDIRTSDAAGAFSSLASGSCQVAVTALQMPSADRAKAGVNETVLGQDGLVIVVNPSNPVQQLTVDQVKKIFTGEISNWSGVGGSAGPIEVILPNDNTDEMTAFRQMVLGGSNVSGASRRVGSLPDVSATVGHDRGAIGLVGFNASDPARVLRLAAGDGTPMVASSLTIGQKHYPLTTTLYLYDRNGSAGLVSQFAAFAGSDPGQALVTSSNFVGRNSF